MFRSSLGLQAAHEDCVDVVYVYKNYLAISSAGNDGDGACLIWKYFVGGLEKYKCIIGFLVEDGWLARDLDLFGGTGVLVLLAELAQGGID